MTYKYGKDFYSIDELSMIFSDKYAVDLQEAKSIVAHNILGEILRNAHMPIAGRKLKKLAMAEYYQHEYKLYGLRGFLQDTKRKRRLNKTAGLFADSYEKYQLGEDGAFFLSSLLNDTFGYDNYPVCTSGLLVFVDPFSLTEEECKLIAKNFKRRIHGKKVQSIDDEKTL